MKLSFTAEQEKELEIVFKAVDAGQVMVGQIRRAAHAATDAGQFVLIYTLVSQQTAVRIRAAIEKEHQKRAAKVRPQ